jgi:hypothetical protein
MEPPRAVSDDKRSLSDEPLLCRVPSQTEDAKYEELVADARRSLNILADNYDTRVWGRLKTGKLPSRWSSQLSWAVATSIAGFLMDSL